MLNGVDTIAFPNHTRAEDFCEFLTEVRNRNPLNRIWALRYMVWVSNALFLYVQLCDSAVLLRKHSL